MTVTKSIDEIRRGTAHRRPQAGARRAPRADVLLRGPSQLPKVADPVVKYLTDDQKRDLVAQLTREMDAAAMNLEFEKAAELRDSHRADRGHARRLSFWRGHGARGLWRDPACASGARG